MIDVLFALGFALALPFMVIYAHFRALFLKEWAKELVFLAIPTLGTWFLVRVSEKCLFSRIVAVALLWVGYYFVSEAIQTIRVGDMWFDTGAAPRYCLVVWIIVAFAAGIAEGWIGSPAGQDWRIVTVNSFLSGIGEAVFLVITGLVGTFMLCVLRPSQA